MGEPPGEAADMLKALTFLNAFAVTLIIASAATVQPASAITAELAKKCREMMVRAHPVGPAGSKSGGSSAAEREYFRQCIERDGNMDEPASPAQDGKKDGKK